VASPTTAIAYPPCCFTVLIADPGQVVRIDAREAGYSLAGYFANPVRAAKHADDLNAKRGVSHAMRSAMFVGSAMGWDVPGANPNSDLNRGATSLTAALQFGKPT
jgi:hypothetical protein